MSEVPQSTLESSSGQADAEEVDSPGNSHQSLLEEDEFPEEEEEGQALGLDEVTHPPSDSPTDQHLPSHENYSCHEPDCTFVAKSRLRLIEHETSVHAAKRASYNCDICHMKFTLFANMRRHRMTHLGVRPFECSLCPKKFFRKDHLMEHVVRQHSKQRPYRCPFCVKSFNYRPHLKAHLSRDHGNPNSQDNGNNICMFCGFQASSFSEVKMHFSSCHFTPSSKDHKSYMAEPNENRPYPKIMESPAMEVGTIPQNYFLSPNFPHFPHPSSIDHAASISQTVSTSSAPLHYGSLPNSQASPPNSPPPTVSSTLGKPPITANNLSVPMKSEPPETSMEDSPNGSSSHNSQSTAELSVEPISANTESQDNTNMVPENLTTTTNRSAVNHPEQPLSWMPVNYSSNPNGSIVNPPVTAPSDSSPPPSVWNPAYSSRGGSTMKPDSHLPESQRRPPSPEEYKVPTTSEVRLPSRPHAPDGPSSSHDHHQREQFSFVGVSRNTLGSSEVPLYRRHVKLLAENEISNDELTSICPYCGIIFPDRTLYFLHRSLHTDSSPWKCNLCGRQCHDKYDFNAHIISRAHN